MSADPDPPTPPRWSASASTDRLVRALSPADREAWAERAAIMEYDGGMTRADAERAAYRLITGGRR